MSGKPVVNPHKLMSTRTTQESRGREFFGDIVVSVSTFEDAEGDRDSLDTFQLVLMERPDSGRVLHRTGDINNATITYALSTEEVSVTADAVLHIVSCELSAGVDGLYVPTAFVFLLRSLFFCFQPQPHK